MNSQYIYPNQYYSYIPPPQLKQETTDIPPSDMSIEVKPKRLQLENLETPATSLKFLDVYHKSAVAMEEASAQLKRVSVAFGIIAGFFFLVTGFSMMVVQPEQQKQAVAHKLQQAPLDFNNFGDTQKFVEQTIQNGFSTDGIYNSLSMLIWGLIIAKAKAGISSSLSKDSEQVQSSWKKIVKIMVVVALTTFVQMKYNPSSTSNQLNVSTTTGRNLRASAVSTDYQAILQDSISQWRQSRQGQTKKVLTQSTSSPLNFEQTLNNLKEKLQSMASILAFGLFLGYYILTFRRYQASVDKHASLTALMNDPSVRVASGEQANNILLSDNVEEDVSNQQEQMQQKVDQKRAQLFQAIQKQQESKPKFEYELCENFEIELQPQTSTYKAEKRVDTNSFPLSFTEHSGFQNATQTLSKRNMMY